ncbi:MAG: cupin domain-containing protein [Amnibacterium sp.]
MSDPSEQSAPALLAGSTADAVALVPVEPGRIVSRRLLKAPGLSVVRMSLDDAQGLDPHQAQVPLLIQVVEGELDATAGDWSGRLTGGATLYVPPRIPHSLRAVGPAHVLLLSLHGSPAPQP